MAVLLGIGLCVALETTLRVIGYSPSQPDPRTEQGAGDGVTFVASLQTDDGAEAVIFRADLDPFGRASDRGWHDRVVSVGVSLSPTPRRLVLETTGGSQQNADWDWAGWSPVSARVLRY
jgi:hypothetical protein